MTSSCALILRQEEEALSLATLLKKKGVESYLCPLFKPHFFPIPVLETPQALIITSKNALRALEDRSDLKTLPFYVVGDETAALAKAMGFLTVFSAAGTSKEVEELIRQKASPTKGILWHLSGEVIQDNLVETLTQYGFRAKRHIVYSLQDEESLPPPCVTALKNHTITHILFFSPRTTALFIDLLKKEGLENHTAAMTSLCLSQNVVEKTQRLSWKKVWVSPKPTLQDMMGYFDENK